MQDYKSSIMIKPGIFFGYVAVMALALFAACNGQSDGGAADVNLGPDDSLMVISEPGFEMKVVLSKTLLANDPARIRYDQNLGHLEVSVGDHFDLQLIDDSMDVNHIKAELQEDQLMSYIFRDAGTNQLDYEAVLPDGNVLSHYYMGLHSIGGKTYFIRTNPDKEFTRMQVDKMKSAIRTMH
ncbi:MAG: hypothetical protein KDC12_09620 [Flavobacteriales bacterium]|nr:hypothetical protein [Flavobacteriales bacterium]